MIYLIELDDKVRGLRISLLIALAFQANHGLFREARLYLDLLAHKFLLDAPCVVFQDASLEVDFFH